MLHVDVCSLMQTPTDVDLEVLCKLLTVGLLTGVGFSHDQARACVDKYFEDLLEFSRPQSQFSSRIRFLIDVRLATHLPAVWVLTPFCCT